MHLKDIHPQDATSSLSPQIWDKVNRLHLCKALSEFAHELLIHPVLVHQEEDWGHYQLSPTACPEVVYRFRAQILSLDHWHIDALSVRKYAHGDPQALDSLQFIIEFSQTLGISEEVLPTYLEEISSTLYSSAFKHSKANLSAQELVDASFQEIETSMMEGHPSFVANNGRIGFDAFDFKA